MRKIGFRQEHDIEEKEEIKEEKEELKDSNQKQQNALESMAKLAADSGLSANEMLIQAKIKLYMDLFLSDEFALKTPEEKEAILSEVMWLQSLSTELTILNSQMHSVIHK